MKTRLIVYTVLVGEKESLIDPCVMVSANPVTDLDISFVCFTDNPNHESKTWTFRTFDAALVPAEKRSRFPKALPHRFFPEFEYSLYIDNTVVFKRLPQLADLDGIKFAGFRHPWREHPRDEADILVRAGMDAVGTVAAQVGFYEAQNAYEGITSLTAGTVLLRKHNEPEVQRFGELWWEQILLFSKRDQLSLDVCARRVGCPPVHFDGDKTNNGLFIWPVLNGGRRVQASFDDDFYGWAFRGQPEARMSPRKHYLEHAAPGEKRYDRKGRYFEYVCLRERSSLGAEIAPRRGLGEVLEPLLTGEGELRILLMAIASEGVGAADNTELKAGLAAIRHYCQFRKGVAAGGAMMLESAIDGGESFELPEGQDAYDLFIGFGLRARVSEFVETKFSKLVKPNGTMVFSFCESLTPVQVRLLLTRCEALGISVSIHHGHHVLSGGLPSSVFVLRR